MARCSGMSGGYNIDTSLSILVLRDGIPVQARYCCFDLMYS